MGVGPGPAQAGRGASAVGEFSALGRRETLVPSLYCRHPLHFCNVRSTPSARSASAHRTTPQARTQLCTPGHRQKRHAAR